MRKAFRNVARCATVVVLTALAAIGNEAFADNAATGGYKLLYAFDRTTGQYPTSQLLLASDGNYYGTTQYGGAYGSGTFFRMTPDGKVAVLHSFVQDGSDGFQPVGNLSQDSAGTIWGSTTLGGTMYLGTVFKWSSNGGYRVVHSFQGAPNGCNQSYAPLVEAPDGSLFGTTSFGGANDQGCAFRLTKEGAFSVVHSFSSVDGIYPQWGLTLATDGNFYGAAVLGGANNAGTIFWLSRGGAFDVLRNLHPAVEGTYPSRLIQAKNGLLYGTAPMGGPSTGGTVFSMSLDGNVTVLHFFTQGSSDGDYPNGVIEGSDGFFYGTNANYGSDLLGTVFRMAPTGEVTVLHKFAPGVSPTPNDGALPQAAPIQAPNGVLIGTTAQGGIPGQWPAYGTIYTINLGSARK